MTESDPLIWPINTPENAPELAVDFERPHKRFICNFPSSLDLKLSHIDDSVTRVFQKLDSRVIVWFSKLITLIISIEILICLPIALLMTGYDGFATDVLLLALVTATLSQIPKRFMWRRRPWMEARAAKRQKVLTSSFPSRACVCAVVFSRGITLVFYYILGEEYHFKWWYSFIYLGLVFIAAFSRINLGVHYLSDCIAGTILGFIVIFIQYGLRILLDSMCGDCTIGTCYADPKCLTCYINYFHLERINFFVSSVFFGSCLMVGVLFIIRPIEFWTKFSRVYGLILPPLCIRLLLLCPGRERKGNALGIPKSNLEWYIYFYASSVSVVSMFIGWRVGKRVPLLAFTLFYLVLLSTLVVWRLFMI